LYEYDFGDLWQHQVRIEKRLEIEASRSYPVCVGGQWAGPPEDCGGPQAFLERRAAAPWRVRELLDDLLEDIKAGDTEALKRHHWMNRIRFSLFLPPRCESPERKESAETPGPHALLILRKRGRAAR
jgi:Plasmid pRiA4b ORF-3-like protein